MPALVSQCNDIIDTIRVIGSKTVSTEMDRIIRDMNAFVIFRLKEDATYSSEIRYRPTPQGARIAASLQKPIECS